MGNLKMLGVMMVLAGGILFANGAQDKAGIDDWPSRPIVMIVPFDPGGATDQIGRMLKPYMEEKLGVPIAVQNMPGGATAVGNQYVYDAPHDGYTILVEPTDITSIGVMGQSKLTWRDWEFLGVAGAVPNAFVVHTDSPIKNIKDLEQRIKTETLSCSVAASGCAWTRGIALYSQLVGGTTPELVPMGGGRPAAVSALKKEVDFASCGLPEAADLVTGDKLRALAYWGKSDIELAGVGTIPSILNAYPEFDKYVPYGGWVGMAVPKGTPTAVLAKLQDAYNYAAGKPEFKDFLKKNYYLEVGLSGKKAEEYVSLSTSVNAWLLYDLGIAPISPDDMDIPRPN